MRVSVGVGVNILLKRAAGTLGIRTKLQGESASTPSLTDTGESVRIYGGPD